ncbi:MAG: hypothetical protein IIB71_04620 [Proteobacteria bacterium]|nr:hypothetical protein [Pseudomonadota bacterium]
MALFVIELFSLTQFSDGHSPKARESLKLREKPGGILLLSLVLFVPLIWWGILGWQPSFLLSQHDNLQLLYPYLRDFIAAAGDWQRLMYWPGLQGGVKVHDVIGSMPIAQLLSFLSFNSLTISNLTLFFIQILFGYFSAISVLGVAKLAFRNVEPVPIFVIAMVGLIFAFLPLLGWRLTYGHGNIICGLFVFLCASALLLEEINGTRSLVTGLLSVLALTHSFQSNGYQMVYYSIVFGGPIVLSILFAIPNITIAQRISYLKLPILVFTSALLLSMPKFSGIAANFLGGDMARSIHSGVIYSFTTATLGDWVSSIPWSVNFMTDDRPAFTRHEVNYPMGPIVLALFLLRFGRPTFRLLTGIGISLTLAIIVSMNITPLSTLLIDSVPLLESFRVPARAIMPVVVFITIMGLAALVTAFVQAKGDVKNWLYPVLIVLVAVTSHNYSHINDLLLCLVILLVGISVIKKTLRKDVVLICFAFFVGSAISAFHERIILPSTNPISKAVTLPIKEAILTKVPELKDPLYRASVNFQLQSMGYNSAHYIGISTLNGYWFTLGRFGELYAALNGRAYNSSVSVIGNFPQLASFGTLNKLYNVSWAVDSVADEIKIRDLEPTLGPAWLSGELRVRNSIEEIAATLLEEENGSIDYWRWRALINMDDPVNRGFDTNTIKCQSAEVLSAKTDLESPLTTFKIDLVSEGTCLLTVATNFVTNFKAYNHEGIPLQTLVTYGSLLAVVIPDKTHRVVIIAEAWVPLWSKIAFYVGWILLTILLVFYLKCWGTWWFRTLRSNFPTTKEWS